MSVQDYLLRFYVEQYGETITEELAESLVSNMALFGSTEHKNGGHWSLNESKVVGAQIGVKFDLFSLTEWYIVLNAIYSQYSEILIKFGLSDPQIYGEMALAWLVNNRQKTFKYFFCC